MYMTNLRAVGAASESTLTTCGAEDPYGPGDGMYGEPDQQVAACSAGGNPRSLVPVGLALLFAFRRRRRA